jgi:hypothetical protein
MVIDDNAADVRARPRDAAPHLPVGLNEALIRPELDVLRAMPDRAVARGEAEADAPAHEFFPHLVTGVLISRPLIERCEADDTYLKRYLDAIALPVLARNRQRN